MKFLASLLLCGCLVLAAHASQELNDEAVSGERIFNARWVFPFLSGGSWGRGPHSNGESCADCHFAGTNVSTNLSANSLSPAVLRIGTFDGQQTQPHDIYGNEISSKGVIGKLPPEGGVLINWSTVTMNGHSLGRPTPRVTDLAFGDLAHNVEQSLRMGRKLIGLGLFEMVSEKQLLDIIHQQKSSGITGRINYVVDPVTREKKIGRFGLKSSSPSLIDQVAKAFRDELGVTSSHYPIEPCAGHKTLCNSLKKIEGFELSDARLRQVVQYLNSVFPITEINASNANSKGMTLFKASGCHACHRTELIAENAVPESRFKKFSPYTDLLLHDVGDGLSDGFHEGSATPNEWRTAPLWGIGEHLSQGGSLLHDGRASTIHEAIMWHGGEAIESVNSYLTLSVVERNLLIQFVRTR